MPLLFGQKVVVHAFMQDKKSGNSNDTIYYDQGRKLSWADFQGIPDAHHFGGAVTSSGFAFDSDIRLTHDVININIGVYTFFSKKSSWKKKDINSTYHLLHEQHHFDITRLGAEQFVKEIAKANFTRDNYRQVLEAVFDKVYNQSVELQRAYDAETNHSINQQAQLRWNDKIEGDILEIRNKK
jgi:hypothetical protein